MNIIKEVIEEFILNIKKKQIDLEKKSRQETCCFNEFNEKTKEKWEATDIILKDFVKEKLRSGKGYCN